MLSQYLRCSPATRAWFSNSVLFSQPSRFSEYLLECPRYGPVLYRTAQLQCSGLQCGGSAGRLQADRIHRPLRFWGPGLRPARLPRQHPTRAGPGLRAVRPPPAGRPRPALGGGVGARPPPHSGRLHTTFLGLSYTTVLCFSQYFNLFALYANLGAVEKRQLLRLNLPSLLISVALDDGPGPPIKYQYAELAKLYQVH